jgi:hypothetical protein
MDAREWQELGKIKGTANVLKELANMFDTTFFVMAFSCI